MSARDRAVQKTDDDAAGSKISAVQKGYYDDPYIALFTRTPTPRFPLINIGTYCRVRGLDKIIDAFLDLTSARGPRQIVSLGAGSDTRPFTVLNAHKDVVYHELDFPLKVKKKTRTILGTPKLRQIIGMTDQNALDQTEIHTDSYHLHAIDLRDLASLQIVKDAPTLVISECCLCYLAPDESASVLNYFKSNVTDLAVVLYEPIGLGDEFGRVMADNLSQRGLCLPTFQQFNTRQAQKDRLNALGLHYTDAKDQLQVYEDWIPVHEKQRIARLEILDEVEEMHMLLKHYCLAWGASFEFTLGP